MGGGSTGFRSGHRQLVVDQTYLVLVLPLSFDPATRARSGPCRMVRSYSSLINNMISQSLLLYLSKNRSAGHKSYAEPGEV